MAHTETEIVSKPLVKKYLTLLVNSYGIRPQQSDKALRILFKQGLYGECVFELMKKMSITNRVKVTCYADAKYPRLNSGAFISIPTNVPRFASAEFQQWIVPVGVKKSTTLHFASFVYAVAHELSHVVLYSTGHNLRHSEIATDLFLITSGFGEIMKEGKFASDGNLFSTGVYEHGYVPLEYISYGLEELKKMQKKKTVFNKITAFFIRQ